MEHVARLVGIRPARDHHLCFPDCSAAINGETTGRPIVAVRSGSAPGLEQRRPKRDERWRQLRDRRDDFGGDLVGVNWIVGLLTYRNKKLEALIEGRPEVLIRDGKLFQQTLEHAKLTRHEVMTALREAGCASIEEVRAALLENDGSISVIPKSK